MILYRSMGHCVTLRNLCIVIREKHIWRAMLFACPAAGIALALKMYEKDAGSPWFDERVMHQSVYEAVTVFVSFIVVFRIQASYDRFFEGCESSYVINGDLADTCSLLTSFCRLSKADAETVSIFRQKLVRLLSLLNALIYADLRKVGDKVFVEALEFEVLDAKGLDNQSLKTLKTCKNPVEVVFYWIQSLIVENMGNGVLEVPPPILSRVLVELGAAMVRFHAVQNVAVVLFPFPLASTTELLLILSSCVTPVVIVNWTYYVSNATIFAFILVFVLWFLNGVAAELENPFDGGLHSLNAHEMQRLHNARLASLVQPELMELPKLSSSAKLDLASLRQETRAVALSKASPSDCLVEKPEM